MQAKVIKEGLTANQVEGIVDTAVSPVESQVSSLSKNVKNLKSQVSSLVSSELHYVFDCREVRGRNSLTLTTTNNAPLKFIILSFLSSASTREYTMGATFSLVYSNIYNTGYDFNMGNYYSLEFPNDYTITIKSKSDYDTIISITLIS